MSCGDFDPDLVFARGAFKSGHPDQSMPDRQRVTEATETARVGSHRFTDGTIVDAVKVYFGRGVDIRDESEFEPDTIDALHDVVDRCGLVPAEYNDDDGSVVFVPERFV